MTTESTTSTASDFYAVAMQFKECLDEVKKYKRLASSRGTDHFKAKFQESFSQLLELDHQLKKLKDAGGDQPLRSIQGMFFDHLSAEVQYFGIEGTVDDLYNMLMVMSAEVLTH